MEIVDDPQRGPAGPADTPEAARARAELVFFVQLLQRRVPKVRATVALIAINVAVYALMVLSGVAPLSPDPADVLAWGAARGPEVQEGQAWRLLTSMFLHFGLLHIGFNMWVLKTVGPFVERLYGHGGFLVIYLVSGLVASAAGMAFNPHAVSAGASGAIFGVVGGLIAALLVRPPEMPLAFALSLRRSMLEFVVLNVVLGLAVPQIALSAHLGGLVAGLGCGLALGPRGLLRPRPGSERLRRASLVLLTGLLVTAGTTAVALRRVDPLNAALARLAPHERASIDAYTEALAEHAADRIGDEEFARQIEEEVLPTWRRVLPPIDALSARVGAADPRVDALRRYAAHRQRAWELMVQELRTGDADLRAQQARQVELGDEAREELEALVSAAGEK